MFSAHEARLRCGMFCLCMRHGFVAARAADRYAPAAHTLTEALLPTTCVVVNKPPGLKHFPTTGAAPRLSESRSRVPRNRRSAVPLHVACLKMDRSTCHLNAEGRRQKAEGENTVFLSRTTRILIGRRPNMVTGPVSPMIQEACSHRGSAATGYRC